MAKDLNTLTKDLIQKESVLVSTLTDQFFSGGTSIVASDVASEYERLLIENLTKLKSIACEDFDSANANSKQLTEDTKTKLHEFIIKTFNSQKSTKDFTDTTGAIFENVNKKIREDLLTKSAKAAQSRASLTPDIADVFLNPLNKPPEEVEAEKLLQQFFEDELVEFNEQIMKDFIEIDKKIGKNVENTKHQITETLHNEQFLAATKNDTQKTIPNFPTSSAMQQQVGGFLTKAEQDFQQSNQQMIENVNRKQEQINNTVKGYAEKVLGKDFFENTLRRNN